jgi:hypothetical protein
MALTTRKLGTGQFAVDWNGKLLVAGFQADRIGLQGPEVADFGALA